MRHEACGGEIKEAQIEGSGLSKEGNRKESQTEKGMSE